MIVVIGGHSRNVGKTSVAAGIIRETAEFEWIAIKITQFGHGVCARVGEACGCDVELDHPFALTREIGNEPDTDSARFLAARAKESWWLRTRQGELGHAVPALRSLVARGENVIVESNSALQYLDPDLYLVVADPAVSDFKLSTRMHLDRADAVVRTASGALAWSSVSDRILSRLRMIDAFGPAFCSAELIDFVRSLCKAPLENVR